MSHVIAVCSARCGEMGIGSTLRSQGHRQVMLADTFAQFTTQRARRKLGSVWLSRQRLKCHAHLILDLFWRDLGMWSTVVLYDHCTLQSWEMVKW